MGRGYKDRTEYQFLARVSKVLADERNVNRDREWNLVKMRFADQFSTKAYWIEFQVARNIAACIFYRLLDHRKFLSFRLNRYDHAGFHFE